MKEKISIIVGGTGQFGICLSKYLLKKKHKVIVTSRFPSKANKIYKKYSKIKILKLNVLDIKKIRKILILYQPQYIFYFAGLSSPKISFIKKRETYQSNYEGCKNFLEIIKKDQINCKFLNASSCEVFAASNKKLGIKSKMRPVSPYGKAKQLSFNITRLYREKFNLKSFNAIIFNTESIYRDKNFLIPKICIAAINAFKYKKKTSFGNINIAREWNWCDEQIKFLIKFIEKKPQDFILSNGKLFSAQKMLNFAFKYFKLNFKHYIYFEKKHLRKKDFKIKRSDFNACLKRNNLKRKSYIFGKKLVEQIIKENLNEKQY